MIYIRMYWHTRVELFCISYSTFMLWSIPHYKKIRKESEVNVMDMCYDGTLVLPNSYAVMDEEEMMPFGMSRTYIVICF